jgi:hypothetical protein
MTTNSTKSCKYMRKVDIAISLTFENDYLTSLVCKLELSRNALLLRTRVDTIKICIKKDHNSPRFFAGVIYELRILLIWKSELK